MRGPSLGPGGEDITWPDQVAPGGQRASSTGNVKPQTSNLIRTLVPKEPVVLPVTPPTRLYQTSPHAAAQTRADQQAPKDKKGHLRSTRMVRQPSVSLGPHQDGRPANPSQLWRMK